MCTYSTRYDCVTPENCDKQYRTLQNSTEQYRTLQRRYVCRKTFDNIPPLYIPIKVGGRRVCGGNRCNTYETLHVYTMKPLIQKEMKYYVKERRASIKDYRTLVTDTILPKAGSRLGLTPRLCEQPFLSVRINRSIEKKPDFSHEFSLQQTNTRQWTHIQVKPSRRCLS